MARRYRPGFALTALALSAAILSAGRTQAQTYPSGKITLIVAFAAGVSPTRWRAWSDKV